MLPSFEIVSRLRPVAVVGPVLVEEEYAGPAPAGADSGTPHPAPYAAVEVDLADAGSRIGELRLTLASGDVELGLGFHAATRGLHLSVRTSERTTTHRSRRHGRAVAPDRLGLALTGTHLTAFSREDGAWVVRARVDLADRCDTRDEAWLAGLTSAWAWHATGDPAPVTGWRAGGFGQLGLRDVRVVTGRDGRPHRVDGRLLLTATSAGPGFFDTAHTSVWALDDGLGLTRLSDLFFRRPDRSGAYGDHATHLVRDDDGWLVATSTWGDFAPGAKDARMAVTLARTEADLLVGRHLLTTRELALPTDGLDSVGVWDPHLVHDGTQWLVGFVSARKYFDFHPALAAGPSLDDLALRAALTDRTATEGTTLLPVAGGGMLLLASDGRDNRRGVRERYPVWRVTPSGVDALEPLRSPYVTNIPWPTLVAPEREGADWIQVTFDGTAVGGPLPGYGTHGDVVVMRGSVRDRLG